MTYIRCEGLVNFASAQPEGKSEVPQYNSNNCAGIVATQTGLRRTDFWFSHDESLGQDKVTAKFKQTNIVAENRFQYHMATVL